MKIIGCDYHPSFQQIAMLDLATREYTRKKLPHASGEAAEFYRSLQGERVRVGVEATGSTRWFERLLEEPGQELVMGDATRIRKLATRKQKTDARDAEHLLQLLQRGQFPAIWVPSAGERSARAGAASAQAGRDAYALEEPVAACGAERRPAEEAAAVDQAGPLNS